MPPSQDTPHLSRILVKAGDLAHWERALAHVGHSGFNHQRQNKEENIHAFWHIFFCLSICLFSFCSLCKCEAYFMTELPPQLVTSF